MTEPASTSSIAIKGRASYGDILRIAWPIILANAAIPLLGLVDTAVVGNLGNPIYLGAVAIGATIFNFIYWGFGFLRMATTGLTAQAVGANNTTEIDATLFRAILAGAGLGAAFLILQWPIGIAALYVIGGSDTVQELAWGYFTIRIWGAPAMFATMAIMGWFIGQEKTRLVLIIQLVLNGLNIALDLWFVVGLGWAANGVAAATLIAEWVAFLLAVALVWRLRRQQHGTSSDSHLPPLDQILEPAAVRRTVLVNSDVMIRSFCLVIGFTWFTAQGAKMGDIVLAANAVLMQFFFISTYLVDGIAIAAETLVGRFKGAKDRFALRETARQSFVMGGAIACAMSAFIFIFGLAGINALTNVAEVRNTAAIFLPYMVLMPVIGVWCFVLDGIFIGATRTADMRNAMLVSILIYIASWFALAPYLGNHGHWLAFLGFFAVRGLTLAFLYPGLERDVPVRQA